MVSFPEKPDKAGKYSTTRDQVYTKAENPLIYAAKAATFQFRQDDIIFYRFHAVPPLLFEKHPEYEALSIEHERELSRHWVGYFAATGFISRLRRV